MDYETVIKWIERNALEKDFNDFCRASNGDPVLVLLMKYYELKKGFNGYLTGKELATI